MLPAYILNVVAVIACVAYAFGGDGEKKNSDLQKHRDKEVKPYFIRNTHELNCSASNLIVELNCEVGGSPEPNITWYKKYEKVVNEGSGSKRWTLTLNLSDSSSYGNFMCNACNRLGCVNQTYVIDSTTCDKSITEDDEMEDIVTAVEEQEQGQEGKGGNQPRSPYFVHKKMHKIHVKPAGHVITFRCKAGGYPTPNITWYKNNGPLARSLGDVKYNNFNLQLQDLILSDAGNYTCKVCNYLGCLSFTYSLEVVERFPAKPYIKEGYPKNVTGLVNSTVKFECPQILTDLEPYIQWIYTKTYPEVLSNFSKADNILSNLSQPEVVKV